MSDFSGYSNILPDPNNSIASDGSADSANAGYAAGPGFASVSLKSTFPTQKTRTNSGSTIVRNIAGHKWDISITYNPLTRSQFEPLYAFLLQRKGGLSHFFAELPQYKTAQDSQWNTYLNSSTVKTTGAVNAGLDNFLITNNSGTTLDSRDSSSHGTPSVGDIFSITDTNDSNHTKVYMVTRVETRDHYLTGSQPAQAQIRVHFTPPLQRLISAANTVEFKNVKFRVINTKPDISYNLDVNNLYKISLGLEEAQP
jgi:hypothetical protein